MAHTRSGFDGFKPVAALEGIVRAEDVADHYRERGYTVRERVKVRGSSGHVHALDMVAQGPLGNLAIAIEDAGGLEGPEIYAVKRAAKDIGATPVMAATRIPDGLRRQAAQAGVVLLDEGALHKPLPEEPASAGGFEHPPWPGTEAKKETAWPDPEARGKSTDPGIWRYPRGRQVREPAAAPGRAAEPAAPPSTAASAAVEAADASQEQKTAKTGFDWLPKQVVAQAPLTSGPTTQRRAYIPEATLKGRVPEPAVPAARRDNRWVWIALIGGAAAGGTFYALSFILG